jgi:hypothetical protein
MLEWSDWTDSSDREVEWRDWWEEEALGLSEVREEPALVEGSGTGRLEPAGGMRKWWQRGEEEEANS